MAPKPLTSYKQTEELTVPNQTKDKLAKSENLECDELLVTFFWLQFVCLEMCTYASLNR